MTDAKIIEVLWIVILLGFAAAVRLWHLQQMKIDLLREHIRLHMTQGGTVRVSSQQLQGALDLTAHAVEKDGKRTYPVKITLA